MSEVIYEVDISQLDSVLDKVFFEIPEKAMAEWVDMAGTLIQTKMIQFTPRGKTGGLISSIEAERGRTGYE